MHSIPLFQSPNIFVQSSLPTQPASSCHAALRGLTVLAYKLSIKTSVTVLALVTTNIDNIVRGVGGLFSEWEKDSVGYRNTPLMFSK